MTAERACCACGRPILEGMWRRTDSRGVHHKDCGLAAYQLDHRDLALEEAARRYLALNPARRSSGNPGERLAATPRSHVSDVTIRNRDGEQRRQPAYTDGQARRIVGKGQRTPRGWDETVSTHGGGHDRAR